MPKRDKPETTRQAQTWETVKNQYREAGLCNGCAGQAAYGHQMGFARINPPCRLDAGRKLPEEIIERHGDRAQRWLDGHWSDDQDEVR